MNFDRCKIYPSIRKPVELSTFNIAAERSSRTASLLTKSPFFMVSWSSRPLAEPEATSARSRSPVDKCENLYFATMRSHCVPFPQPGPPRTQMIGTFESMTLKTIKISIKFEFNFHTEFQQKAHQVRFKFVKCQVIFSCANVNDIFNPIMQ